MRFRTCGGDNIDPLAQASTAEITIATSVEGPAAEASETGSPVPRVLTLLPPLPNPAERSIELRYGLPLEGAVRVSIYDVTGRELARLVDGNASPGWHSVVWNGRDEKGAPFAPGVYLVRALGFGSSEVERVVLVK